MKPAGHIAVVGCGPGAADLLTVRARRAIVAADVVLHDSLVSRAVLDLVPPHARCLRVGRRNGEGVPGVAWTARLMAREATRGLRVVRLHGGDPSIFARLAEEVAALRALGAACDIVPGITAATAAAACAQVPLTARGVAATVAFVPAGNPAAVAAAATLPHTTLAFYMAGAELGAVTRLLLAQGYAAATPAGLFYGTSQPEERVVLTTLGSLRRLPPQRPSAAEPPVLLLVGETLATAALRPTRGHTAASIAAARSPGRQGRRARGGRP